MVIENADGTTTWFQQAGGPEHPAMVLLHGIGADHEMWAPQMTAFADAGYFVLAPDLLGHGRSSKVKTLALSDWNRQIDNLLRQKGLERCILIGVSMGGVIAQSHAIHAPEKVSRLILCDTFGELKTFREKALGAAQVWGFRLYKLLGRKMMARGMASAYKQPFAHQARDYFIRKSMTVDFDQLILARKAINRIDAIGKIDGERIPALVMAGDGFGEAFIEVNRKIATGIEGAKFVVLKNAMDPSNLVNPPAFNRETLAFLAER
jgi:pimeloyl-ACP methyl ester carboxylesterase